METSIMKKFAAEPFNLFNRKALNEAENNVLDGGIRKHTRILKLLACFLPGQLLFPLITDSVLGLLTATSFITLLLGGAWYAISFQNVSSAQLDAGVADYITEKMFGAFVLCLSTLAILTAASMIVGVFPESLTFKINWSLKVLILFYNLAWFFIVVKNVYQSSVAYDAADSLLGDGFPTLMRGAKANAENESLSKLISMLIEEVRSSKPLQE